MADVEQLPAELRAAIAGLSDEQIDTPYREGGWTIRQVVHHLADSHSNGYTRLKLALTEDSPTIKPYEENAWAQLADSRLPLEVSLPIIEGIHRRWIVLWRVMTPEQFERKFVHPEHGPVTTDWLLGLYGWHGRHHVAHITRLRERMGW